MKAIFLFALCFFFSYLCRAQTLTPSVINATGASARLGAMEISYSVGEAAVTTLQGASDILTQGFLQPEYSLITSVQETSREEAGLSVYPNPVRDELFIRTSFPGTYRFTLINALGARLTDGVYTGQPLQVSAYAKGIYFLQLINIQTQQTTSFKIVKY